MWCLHFTIHFYLLLLKALSFAILIIVRSKSNFQLGIETNVEFGLIKKETMYVMQVAKESIVPLIMHLLAGSV